MMTQFTDILSTLIRHGKPVLNLVLLTKPKHKPSTKVKFNVLSVIQKALKAVDHLEKLEVEYLAVNTLFEIIKNTVSEAEMPVIESIFYPMLFSIAPMNIVKGAAIKMMITAIEDLKAIEPSFYYYCCYEIIVNKAYLSSDQLNQFVKDTEDEFGPVLFYGAMTAGLLAYHYGPNISQKASGALHWAFDKTKSIVGFAQNLADNAREATVSATAVEFVWDGSNSASHNFNR